MMNQSKTILIIDDDDFLRQAMVFLLTSVGYNVAEASTGADGIRLAKESVPDLILLDVVLPDINGIDVCRQLKQNPSPIASSIVLLSGKIIDSEAQAIGLEAGADDYRMFEANINGLQYLSARLTARSAGEVTVVVRLFNN